MKRTLFRIMAVVFTLVLTAGMLKVAMIAFDSDYKGYAEASYSFFCSNQEYDVLFFGSSHTSCGIYPLQLWKDFGIISYNLGVSGTLIPSSFHVLKNAICCHKPKVVFLDSFSVGSDEKITGGYNYLHWSFDAIPLTYQKYESCKDLFPDDFQQQVSFLLPYSLFHNRWKELTAEKVWDKFFNAQIPVSKGSLILTNVSTPSYFKKTGTLLKKNTVGMDYIRSFISLCRENSIIPILLTIPYPASETRQMEENSVALLSKELGVPYYNMNKTDVIDWDTDLQDSNSHLNMSGARKVTDYIGRLLVETYRIADHRNDPAYVSWHDDFQQYKHQIFYVIRIQTDIKTSLMLCNNSVYTARLSVKDGTEMDPVIQKLVAQLGDAITVETIPAGGESNQDSTPPACDIHLEVYDSETGDFVCAKNWDFQSRTEFVYRN